eukprot:14130404-Ditylum_brightwellii.AAC.1
MAMFIMVIERRRRRRFRQKKDNMREEEDILERRQWQFRENKNTVGHYEEGKIREKGVECTAVPSW